MRKCIVLLFVLVFLCQGILVAGDSGPVRINDPGVIDRISREVTLHTISQKHYFVEERTEEQENGSWRKKHPVAFGTLLGLSIGFGTGLVFGSTSEDTEAVYFAVVLGAIGAGIGALAGSFSEY